MSEGESEASLQGMWEGEGGVSEGVSEGESEASLQGMWEGECVRVV